MRKVTSLKGAAASPAKGGAAGQQHPDAPSVPVFIENTRELFSYPLEKGALTRVSDLANTIAKKMKVPHTTLTFKVHRARIGSGDRLCSFPDGTVIQCHCDSDTFSQINLSSPANTADFSTATGAPVSARSIVSDDAPTVVSDTRSLRKLDLSKSFAGTQANVTLADSPSSAVTTGRGSVALPQPQVKVKLLTLSVGLEGCDEAAVTVDVTSSVADLRVRCSVSVDDFPTVSCNGRRILFEQRSFAEQLISENSKIIFHTKRDEDWEDGSRLGGAEAVASVSRLMRTSGGKAIPLNSDLQPRVAAASSSPAFAGSSSPSRVHYQQQQHSRIASDLSYNSNNSSHNNNIAVPGASPIQPLSPAHLREASSRAAPADGPNDIPPSPNNFNKGVSPSRVSSSARAPAVGATDVSAISGTGTAPYAAADSSRPSPPRHPYNNYGGRSTVVAAGPAGLNSTNLNMSSNSARSAAGPDASYNNNNNNSYSSPPPHMQAQNQSANGGGGGGGPVHVHISPRARNPSALLKEHSKARQREQIAQSRQNQMLLRTPLAAAAAAEDNPSRNAWITPAQRPEEYATPEYEAARNGCSLCIQFEDPTDGGYIHDLRVWSLNPVAHLWPFAGDDSEQRYHMLCDGELVLYPHHAFATVTKGRQYCHFSFARKE